MLVAPFVAPLAALAAEPTSPPAPTARLPTCAERFPEEGPAGVDLRLGCIVSELVGLYSTGQASAPTTLSTYAVLLAGSVIALGVVAWMTTRLLSRRAGAALAPRTPDAWWQCGSCRSINGANATRCYSCGAHRPSEPEITLSTAEVPGTPQSFGRGKHDAGTG